MARHVARLTAAAQGPNIISFKGGPQDGETIVSPARVGINFEDAERIYLVTKGASVGGRFFQVSPGYWDAFRQQAVIEDEDDESIEVSGIAPAQSHVYEIIERQERGDDVSLRCEYRGLLDVADDQKT